MKKTTFFKGLLAFVALVFMCNTGAFAQLKVGNNPTTINGGSVLEMESTDKGMLLPRVALTSANVWGLSGTPVAGMLVYNTASAGTGANVVNANTIYTWNGTNWERLQKGSDTYNGSSSFVVGEIRTSRMVVPASVFTGAPATILYMTGKASNSTSTTTRAAGFPNATNSPTPIIINGLRLDFIRSPISATDVAPKLYNTTVNPILYTVSTLSTTNAYITGAGTTIAPNAYSFNIDGDDNLSTSNNGSSEYVNAMLTFSNGEWYNCTWYATTDGLNYYLFVTAQRLN
ncbi:MULTISPECIES: hypothetical protein [unclassified Spirosoma]|uniref:hypothetical protein n=1 Tax=unclassified Spirosoma TaxID=2621999 RepID=UPI00095D2F1F|nr:MULTISPECIES: hypothetical protein [unclassified Spirosoma]MBN8820506.1 hypothetical protein [Spirosoma sp.]OJW71294.1 MAG: hypothetical protein BGO59_03520 [Spirosoma sp. 48-14]